MSTYETQRERELEALVKSFAAVDKANKARIALLEAVAEAAEKFYSDVTLSYPVQDHPLEDALGAAGYLQEEPK